MSLGTGTGHWGAGFLQQWCLGVQKWHQMTLEALVENWLACGGSALCRTTWETFFGHNRSLFGSGIDDGGELSWRCCSSRGCDGGFSARKMQLFKADDPQGDRLSHPT